MTLTMSVAPTRNSASRESTRLRERPKRIVATPNPPTHQSITDPERRSKGLGPMKSARHGGPGGGGLGRIPNPQGPVCKSSLSVRGGGGKEPPSQTQRRPREK